MAGAMGADAETRRRIGARYSVWAFLAPLLGVVLGFAALYGLMRGLEAHYAGRILPGVSVQGVPLGGMTPDDARRVLQGLDEPAVTGSVVFTDGEEEWSAPWAQMGLAPDAQGAVAAAYAIGHDAANRSPRAWVRLWLADHDLQMPLLVNAAEAREALTAAAGGLGRAPVAGSLHLQDGRVVAVAGAAGRALDVEATLEALLAVAQGAPGPVPLAFVPVPAPGPDPEPLQAEVDALTRRQITVSSYDPVADASFCWEIGRDEIASWLRLADGGADGGWRVVVDAARVEDTLAALADELDEGRGFRLDVATTEVMNALADAGGSVTLAVTYPERRYTVQAGDTALVVAARHGMPLWPLAEANPGIDLDMLSVGQELVIPSQDVLLPHPPVPGKRIVINISEQRMRVYQDGAVLHEWTVSTGRDGSPTHTGVFQVLSKEESAYASLWDLEMPHFIGIYASGPGFINGIHALPFLSSGQRLWEGALGTRVSYGCIILGVEEAATLYAWAEPGVTVEVRP